MCCITVARNVLASALVFSLVSLKISHARPASGPPFIDVLSDQHPLPYAPGANGSEWPVFWQDDRTCKAGTPHFTGKVPVSKGRELFFWFTESRTGGLTSPTILWLNGGPGCSSLAGMFEEVGPCKFDPRDRNSTVQNTHSWASFANLLILDQPAGVGFSTVPRDAPLPLDLAEASVDFSAFLSEFTSRFPHYFEHGFFIAGESFGGHYVPRFTSDILRKQLAEDAAALPVTVDGIILVDPAVGYVYSLLGHYELFCTGRQDLLVYNSSTCLSIAAAMPELERLGRICQTTSDPWVCGDAPAFGMKYVYRYFQEEVDMKRRSPYDMRLGCDLPPVCIPPSQFTVEPYLSRPDIQSLLGIEGQVSYHSINWMLNRLWSESPEINLPTTMDISYLLDVGKLRVLVMNGNYDVAVTTPGIFWEFDELPWSKGIQYRLSKLRDWKWTNGKGETHIGGQFKGIPELHVAGIDDAGHMSPGDQKEAVSALVKAWLAV